MPGAITDKFSRASSTGQAQPTTLTAQKAVAASSLSGAAFNNWPSSANSKVHFQLYEPNNAVLDVFGNPTPKVGTQSNWEGIVSGTTIAQLNLTGGTDQIYPIGSIVVALPTAEWANDLFEGITAEHNQDGSHSSISVTGNIDVNDSSTAIRDSSDNELLKFAKTSSAVNEVTITNAATANGPTISATGGDTNIDLRITPKGTGRVVLNGAGAPQNSVVGAPETTTSGAWGDLATVGPTVTVTIGNSGMAQVTIFANTQSTSATGRSEMSFAVSGANTQSPGTDTALMQIAVSAGVAQASSSTFLLTGLNAGSTTFTAKYQRNVGGTSTFAARKISVIPL